MGCGGSSAEEPDTEKLVFEKEEQDEEFDAEGARKRKRFDKKKKGAVEGDPDEKPEFDMFEAQDAGKGEQFMAVRPYEGAIAEPTSHPDPNSSAPDVKYQLEYVYGYRCEDSRANVCYNSDGNVAYMTAAVGVILDKDSNKQTFFGGGQVDNTSKKVANDLQHHTNDIMSFGMSACRKKAVTGQTGSQPVAFMWDACSGEKQQRFKLPKGRRKVTAIALSADGKIVGMADAHNDHNVSFWDASSGNKVWEAKGGPDMIYGIAFSQKEGDYTCGTAGTKHICFWNHEEKKKKKGLYGDFRKHATSHACITFDANGAAYSGGCNSKIFKWEDRSAQSTLDHHGRGFVGAVRVVDGFLLSGGKDKQVFAYDLASGAVASSFSVDSLVRAVDSFGDTIVVGLRNGNIQEFTRDGSQNAVLMSSHHEGEVWGLAVADDNNVISSGDDNKLMVWNIEQRRCVAQGQVDNEDRQPKAGGASSLSDLAPSKCSRAVAVNPANGHVAVAHNDGMVTIRESANTLDNVLHRLTDSAEWLESLTYSPDGTKLAAGSHDNKVYVYDVEGGYSLAGTCAKHNSFICSVDWSEDGSYLRTVCGAHELLFYTTADCEQDPSGASNTVGVEWATGHAKYGWLVEGIFPRGVDGTHINDVEFTPDKSLIATADDYGLVNVWRNPSRHGHKCISLRGHSEHVTRVRFMRGGEYLISAGGYDQTVMQWKRS